MRRLPPNASRGSVALVALCFVAVMGIALASYLAISNQSMKLSNRSLQTGVSSQLAEMGLEQALWSFNRNDWSSWTISGTTATRTITFPSNKYGAIGVTGSINLRVDNYNAFNLPSVWDNSTSYKTDDLVGRNGIWYRCVKNHTNQTPPDLTYWAESPIPWKWRASSAYQNEDVINYNGTWYRCTASHTSPASWTSTNWTAIPTLGMPWSSGVEYSQQSIVYYGGTWYRKVLNLPVIGQLPPIIPLTWFPAEISWRWRSQVYNFNDVVYDNGTWYRYISTATSTNTVSPSGGSTRWTPALNMWVWSSTEAYNLNDAVYYSGSWYRCILAHTGHQPPNATYWSTAPLLSNAWGTGKTYAVNDIVSYGDTWYRCILAHTGQIPTNTTYWASASATTASSWSAATSYSVNNYASYGGVWYRCISAHTNKTPNNSTYWSATKAPVIYSGGVASLPDGSSINTQLRATVAPAPLFPNAAAAATTLSVSGGGTVDSYNSNAGTYASQVGTSTNYSAVVAAGSTAGTAVTLGSTAVKGYVSAPSSSSSPYAPLFSSGGSVKGFTSPPSPNIDLTRISRSPFIPQFDPLPAGGLAAAFSAGNFAQGTALGLMTTMSIGTPGAATPSRYYVDGDLTLGSASVTTLNIDGPVVLYINGDLIITAAGSTGRIIVASTGSAEIHIADSLQVDAGGEGINNLTLDPDKVILICDASNSNSQFYSDGSYPFYGTIYLPNTTNSSGFYNDNSSVQIYGAVAAKKITYSGADANLHYDTSLRAATFGGVDQPYIVTEWRELTAPAEKATLP